MNGETAHETWPHCKSVILQYANHGFTDKLLLQNFFQCLNEVKKVMADHIIHVNIIRQPFFVASRFLDDMTMINQAW